MSWPGLAARRQQEESVPELGQLPALRENSGIGYAERAGLVNGLLLKRIWGYSEPSTRRRRSTAE